MDRGHWGQSDLNRYTGSKIRAVQNARKVIQRRRMSPKSGPKRLRELLQQPGIICSLGPHDVFTALIVEQAGFETMFIGGFGTSASMLGLPDLNFPTMSEMADALRRMADRGRTYRLDCLNRVVNSSLVPSRFPFFPAHQGPWLGRERVRDS
jgi:hypothetical protein